MEIKINKKPKGIPYARATAAPGVTAMGASQVTIFLSALDSFGTPEVVGTLRLSTAEARELAAQLMTTADYADHQARDAAAFGPAATVVLKCAYKDCPEQHPIVVDDDERVTCPTCRKDMGLPELEADQARTAAAFGQPAVVVVQPTCCRFHSFGGERGERCTESEADFQARIEAEAREIFPAGARAEPPVLTCKCDNGDPAECKEGQPDGCTCSCHGTLAGRVAVDVRALTAKPEPLKTETDTPEMHERIEAACRVFAKHSGPFDVFFEHGQWWVTVLESGMQYSVVDAEGGTSIDGFDFEMVTEGDDES